MTAHPSRTDGVAGSKLMTLAEAAAMVHDGDHLALSGFACARNAIAFSHELIRQGRRNLTLSACILGMDADLLVGAGLVQRLIYGGGSLDRFGSLQCVNRAYEQGTVVAEYYSSLAVAFRYLAGALGIPFMPMKSMLGSDLLARLKEETAPDNVLEMTCPFTGDPLVLVRAMVPDVAVVQVQLADAEGNAQILGPRWENGEAAKAAQRVIVVAEELVSTDVIRQQPELTVIPGFRVSGVVVLPYSAHPTSVYRCYDHDHDHLRLYVAKARTEEGVRGYIEEFIREPGDHVAYLQRIGGIAKLAELRADRVLGY
ncbi:MAG: CoA transferase subunit A [Chloroflexi bacterium]|nr:CoA transferase subunit A [Chloroflexota bacterium]